MRPSELFDERERERIEAAVRAAEANTTGEIVVSVVGRCGRHAAAPWRLAVLLAGVTLLGSGWLPITGTLVELFALQALAVVLAHLVCRLDAVRRVFVSEGELQRKAELAALQAFQEHGIRRTEGRTGILIFVALFEHRVIVLADETIDRALDPEESWQEIVDLVLDGLRSNRAAEGIEAGVARCGVILSHPLPAQDERNQIVRGLFLSD